MYCLNFLSNKRHPLLEKNSLLYHIIYISLFKLIYDFDVNTQYICLQQNIFLFIEPIKKVIQQIRFYRFILNIVFVRVNGSRNYL
jgi:hypothetical protein